MAKPGEYMAHRYDNEGQSRPNTGVGKVDCLEVMYIRGSLIYLIYARHR
jgi:hypothetical protein